MAMLFMVYIPAEVNEDDVIDSSATVSKTAADESSDVTAKEHSEDSTTGTNTVGIVENKTNDHQVDDLAGISELATDEKEHLLVKSDDVQSGTEPASTANTQLANNKKPSIVDVRQYSVEHISFEQVSDDANK